MVLVHTQALFWGRRKFKKNKTTSLICEIKRAITNFFFMWPKIFWYCFGVHRLCGWSTITMDAILCTSTRVLIVQPLSLWLHNFTKVTGSGRGGMKRSQDVAPEFGPHYCGNHC
jgi:hypothetical protein